MHCMLQPVENRFENWTDEPQTLKTHDLCLTKRRPPKNACEHSRADVQENFYAERSYYMVHVLDGEGKQGNFDQMGKVT